MHDPGGGAGAALLHVCMHIAGAAARPTARVSEAYNPPSFAKVFNTADQVVI